MKTRRRSARGLFAAACCSAVALSGCAFDGVNSLPLPGTVGSDGDAVMYHVQIPNVGTLESNSPVMVSDVVVGTVRRMKVDDWNADVDVSVKPDVVVPANAVATVGQTSLLGSMHLALDPPVGQPPTGRLQPGSTIPLNRSSTYPSTWSTVAVSPRSAT
jgi:virulence factor Mce-like protein